MLGSNSKGTQTPLQKCHGPLPSGRSALGVAELLPVSCGGLGACGCDTCVLPPGGDALCAAAVRWDEGGREVGGSLCSVTLALSSSPLCARCAIEQKRAEREREHGRGGGGDELV